VFITIATATYSFGHGLCTIPAVPWSTQPSTLHAMVKYVSAFGLSNNNKWRRWMWTVVAIYRQTHSPSRLAWSEGWGQLVLSLHSSNELAEFSICLYGHDDSTINIIWHYYSLLLKRQHNFNDVNVLPGTVVP